MTDRSVRVILSVVASGFSAGMAKAADETQKLTSLTEKQAASIDKLSTGSLLAGAAIAAGIGVAIKAYADFDEAMSHVAATGADAKASLVELRDAALQAGADTAFSATEAAAGVENLLKAGVSAKDVLGGGLAGALSLAAAGEMDVADAAETTATTLAQFGLKGTDASHVADLLAAGAGKAVGEVSDMAAALTMAGTVAAQYGVSVDETVGTLALFAQNAMTGSDAGTSMKQMLLQLASPTEQAQTALDAYNITAYDAQGNFVGMANLAGQLKSQLGGLSQEQQNAALKTIFGADAIRSATILMGAGSDAVKEWTTAVGEQGYAAQVAAEKTNNLKGDLEQLGGSFETTAIKLGASADGPLRGVVQTLTDLVNVAGEAPGPVQATMLTIAGLTAGGLLLAGGLGKAVVAINETRASMVGLGITARGATLAMGAAGVAITIAGLAVGQWLATEADAAQTASDFTDAIVGQTDAINANSRSVAVKKLIDTGALDVAKKLGLELDVVTDASLGNANALAKVAAATAASEDQWVTWADGTMHAENVASTLTRGIDLTSEAFKRGVEEAQKQDEALGKAASTSGDFAAALTGGVVPAENLSAAQQKLVAETKKSTTATDRNADALKRAADAVWGVVDATLKASGTEIGFQASIDDTAKAIKDNAAQIKADGGIWDEHTNSLKLDTDAQRAVASALDDNIATLEARLKAMAEQGAGQAEMNAKIEEGRLAYLKNAEAAGIPKKAAEDLWAAYKLNPGSVTTLIAQYGAEAAAEQAKNLRARIEEIPIDRQTAFLALVNQGKYDEAKAMLDQAAKDRPSTIWVQQSNGEYVNTQIDDIARARPADIWVQGSNGDYVNSQIDYYARDRTATITVSTYYSGANASGTADAATLMRAGGGPIWGPGTGTSDSILARVSNGEYVFKADSVSKIGLDRLDYMNRFGKLPAFRDGGQVHYSQAIPRYAGGGSSSAASASVSGYSAADLRAALSGLTLRIDSISTVGDYAVGRIYDAVQGV